MFCENCGQMLEGQEGTCPRCGKPYGGGAAPKSSPENKEKHMAKLGVELCLLGAGVYWLGLINELAALLLAGCILLKEEDIWVRAMAVKGAVVLVGFGVLEVIFQIGQQMPGGETPWYEFMAVCLSVIALIKYIFLLICGMRALRYKNVKISGLDRFINRSITR